MHIIASDHKGIILRIGSIFFFALMVLCIKFVSDTVPVGQVVFFRSAFALIPLVLYLAITGFFPSGLYTKRPHDHARRCFFGCMAMFASFASLRYLPMSHAAILGYLAPIITVVLSRLFLREQVTNTRWFGVLFGFTGMLILILPDVANFEHNISYLTGVGLGCITALFTAGAFIQIRSLAKTEHAGAIAFYFAVVCGTAGLATLPFGWVWPNQTIALYLIGSGLAGGFAHILMTLSYQYAEASKLATFEYLSLLFAALSDFIFFDIIPTEYFYVASLCILFAAFYVTYKERKLA